MKIDSNFANSINFIEQKKSNSSFDKSISKSSVDRFEGRTLSSFCIEDINNSLGLLEVANESLTDLKQSSAYLKKLTEKNLLFPELSSELNEEFESMIGKVEDILDNTIYNQNQIFYKTHEFNIGGYSFKVNLLEECCIEDFSIEDKELVIRFENSLYDLSLKIKHTKDYLEVANFNKIASLNNERVDSSFPNKISKDELKGAHDENSLREKVDYLLS